MSEKKERWISAVQELFPEVIVRWEPPLHEMDEPCTLILTSKTDPKNTVSWTVSGGTPGRELGKIDEIIAYLQEELAGIKH
jgi:hypothetical protein